MASNMKMSGVIQCNERTLKRLRLNITKDDPMFPGMKKLKLSGKDLENLPHEVFTMHELGEPTNNNK